MQTGKLNMMGYEFFYTFDKKILYLIAKEDEKEEIINSWFLKKIDDGIYSYPGEPKYIEEDFLIGNVNETNEVITFLPNKSLRIFENNGKIIVPVSGFFYSNSMLPSISRIEFTCSELNYIFPLNQAFEISYDAMEHNGKISINTLDFEKTTTDKQIFEFKGEEVEVYFGINRIMSYTIDEPPLKLTSTMNFKFKETQDYSYVLEFNRIAKEFIQFLCNRKNIIFDDIILKNDNKSIGFFHELGLESNIENIPLKEGRYIKQSLISGYEGKILTDISKNNLFLGHLGKTYSDSRVIDASSFVLRTAAFEWEFGKLFKEVGTKKEATLKIEAEATREIDILINDSQGNLKKIYKKLKKSIPTFVSLSEKINIVFDEYGEVILDRFGKYLYGINDISYDHSDIGIRMAKQRNNFAHGNLDKEFINESLMDVVFFEQVVLVMQLKYFDLDNNTINNIINNLFRYNFTDDKL